MRKIIFHIDVNSAYLSWTAVEELKNGGKVDLRQIPAIIGGVPPRSCSCKISVGKKVRDQDGGTGCKCIPEMPESYHESTGS